MAQRRHVRRGRNGVPKWRAMTDRDDKVEVEAGADAADWFARLQSDAAGAEDWNGFEVWLAADPAHEAAFRAIEALWIELESPAAVETLLFPRRAARAKGTAWKRGGQVTGVARPARWIAAGLAAASLAALTFVIAGGSHFLGGASAETSVETPVDQTRTFGLNGGVATVEGGTRLEVTETSAGQRVRLLRGAASFRLKHDPARPLTVLAAGQQISDIGTVFTTRLTAFELQVSVSEGEVEVQPFAGPGQSLRVRGGQALVRRTGEASSQVMAADLTALRRPYRDAPLTTVVADLNQFYSRPITIEGADTGRLHFTGVLILDSEDAVVRRLEAYLPVSARGSAATVVLASRRGKGLRHGS